MTNVTKLKPKGRTDWTGHLYSVSFDFCHPKTGAVGKLKLNIDHCQIGEAGDIAEERLKKEIPGIVLSYCTIRYRRGSKGKPK